MIHRLLIFTLLVFSLPTFAEIKLDPGLIRRWSQNLDGEYPGDQPVIAHYKQGAYELYYLAASHSNDLNSPTLKLVSRLFFGHQFDALLVEPFPYSKGESPPWFLKLAKQGYHGDFILGGEPALAIIRADSKKIPFFGGEPDHRDVFQALKKQGYSDLDVLGFYVVRQIPQWVREKQDRAGLLERNVPKFVTVYCKEFSMHPCASLKDIRLWYKTKMRHELTADIKNEEVSPFAEGTLLTQKLSSATGDFRDRYTLKIMQQMLEKYKRVAVVYGSGHFVTLRKSLDDAFGPPTFETVNTPLK